MRLNILSNNLGAKKTGKRLGRGIGSGKGKTCGRGVKGQKSRAGVAIKGFEGGQTPLIKRLPKRGFSSLSPKKCLVVNITDISKLVSSSKIDISQVITKEILVQAGIIKTSRAFVKLLSIGKPMGSKLILKLDAYSNNARKAVESAGWQIT